MDTAIWRTVNGAVVSVNTTAPRDHITTLWAALAMLACRDGVRSDQTFMTTRPADAEVGSGWLWPNRTICWATGRSGLFALLLTSNVHGPSCHWTLVTPAPPEYMRAWIPEPTSSTR